MPCSCASVAAAAGPPAMAMPLARDGPKRGQTRSEHTFRESHASCCMLDDGWPSARTPPRAAQRQTRSDLCALSWRRADGLGASSFHSIFSRSPRSAPCRGSAGRGALAARRQPGTWDTVGDISRAGDGSLAGRAPQHQAARRGSAPTRQPARAAASGGRTRCPRPCITRRRRSRTAASRNRRSPRRSAASRRWQRRRRRRRCRRAGCPCR